MRSIVLFGVGMFVGALSGGAAYHFDIGGLQSWAIAATKQPTQDIVAPVRASLTALGTIEPANGVVNVASPLVGHKIQSLSPKLIADNGQTGRDVAAGEELVLIDDASIATELEVAQAQLSSAQRQLALDIQIAEDEIDSSRQVLAQLVEREKIERQAQQQQIDAIEQKLAQAKKDHARLLELHEQSETLASEQDVERSSLAIVAAETELNDAKTAHFRINQTLASQRDTATKRKEAAERQLTAATDDQALQSLKHQVTLTKLKKEQAKVRSPLSGTIIKTFARPGQLVGQGPLLQVANLDEIVGTVEVDAGDINLLEISDVPTVTISCRAWGNETAEGHVKSIGNVVADAALSPLNPLEPVNRHVVDVIVSFKLPKSVAHKNRSALLGLPIRAEFAIGDQSHVHSAEIE